MEMETRVISTEIIKPSSPTPKSLQIHRLSFLDQIAPFMFTPFVYLYASNDKFPNSQKSNHLKKSLSQVLTRFYPLAGRLVGNRYVDCEGGGVPFFEAETNCDLEQLMTYSNPREISELLLPYKMDEPQDFCMAVQATYFRCGGAAVGFIITHKISDALSSLSFAKSWSAVARNVDGGPQPEFDAATYFPPRDVPELERRTEMMMEEVVIKIFTFSAAKIDVLRGMYSSAARRSSRVEALSAFIWNRFASATGISSDPNKVYTVHHVANLRGRTDPPLSEYQFGNLWVLTVRPEVSNSSVELRQRVREAVKAVDGGYMDLLREVTARADKGELVPFCFSSLCGFPLHEVDFGWGEPVWMGTPGFNNKNAVIFKDTRNGGGVEAWVHLRKEDMDKFEVDSELQDFLSHDKCFLTSKI